MKVLSKEEVQIEAQQIREEIRKGAVFIHPTDTIYGLGCDATNENAVAKIRKIKERFARPFSVIAPSKDWIRQNCELPKEAEAWLKKLPGPYTLILKLKSRNAVSKSVNMGMATLGIRIPDHWFSKFVEELNIPVITTSANKTEHDYMTSLDNLDNSIKQDVDFIIYEGEKAGKPSQLVDLSAGKAVIKSR